MTNEYVKKTRLVDSDSESAIYLDCDPEEATHQLTPIKPKAWEPKSEVPDYHQWYVSGTGCVEERDKTTYNCFKDLYKQDRTFRTKEEAEAFATKERCLTIIRQHAEETQECKGKWSEDKLLTRVQLGPNAELLNVWYNEGFDIHVPENINVKKAYLDYIEAE